MTYICTHCHWTGEIPPGWDRCCPTCSYIVHEQAPPMTPAEVEEEMAMTAWQLAYEAQEAKP